MWGDKSCGLETRRRQRMVSAAPKKMATFDQCAHIIRLDGENRRQDILGPLETAEQTQFTCELDFEP